MDPLKRDRVWAPDPIEGYVLGYIADFNGEALTIELADSPGKVRTILIKVELGWQLDFMFSYIL